MVLLRLARRPGGTNNTHLFYTKASYTLLLGRAPDRETLAHYTGEVDQPGMGRDWTQLFSVFGGEVKA